MKKFTLIELLVVLAILGLLVTMLLPSLSNARKEAERAVCLSNMKQVAAATMAYANHNNMYPPIHEMFSGTRDNWHEKLVPEYLGEGDIPGGSEALQCPSAPPLANAWSSNIGISRRMVGSDHLMRNDASASRTYAVCNFAQVKSPSETALFGDSSGGRPVIDTWYVNPTNNHLYGDKTKICRHNKKSNLMFFDLSAKAMHYKVLGTKVSYSSVFWDPTKE